MRRLLLLAAILTVSAAPSAPLSARADDAVEQVPQLIQSGKLEEARSLLTAYLKGHPTRPDALTLLGVVEAQQGNYREAEACFHKALAADPRFVGAYLNLGRLYEENPQKDPEAWKKGTAVYDQLLEFDPSSQEGYYQSALLRLRLGRYQESLDRLAHLPRESQERAQALAVRCGDYAGLGQPNKAEQAADQMLGSADIAEADVTTILPVLAARKNMALSLKLLEGLEARNLATFDSLYSLGLLYQETGRLPEARRALESAIQFRPNSATTLLELARVANAEKDNTGALGYLAHARELEPNNAAIYFFWGMVAIEQDLSEEAYQSLKKAVAIAPHNAWYNYAFGVVAMQRENASESIPYLRKYCELRPHDLRGRLALGVGYFNSHEEEQAAQILSSISSDPATAAGANFFLARISNHRGQYPAALDHLHRALQAQPNYAEAYAELGSIHIKRKEYPQAEEALDKALQLNPSSYGGNLNLLILYQRTNNPKANEQAKRFEQVKAERDDRAKEFLRTIEVRP
jgi:tetratricopeptide (TPR) repeat protein